MSKKDTKAEIEKKRQELYKKAQQDLNLNAHEIIEKSQEIDQKIIEYYRDLKSETDKKS